MRRTRYFNAVLTLNAALLAALLWVFVSERAMVASVAAANEPPPPTGIPDAGEQRVLMIKELKSLNQTVAALAAQLKQSEIKVQVTTMPKVELASPSQSNK